MINITKVKRALISVSDKEGIVDFAKKLSELKIEIISTGGTARVLKEAGIEIKDISDFTGFPEMMDGRVKTLHPKVHGGLLALRDNKQHMKEAKENNVELIDMVVVNLYPFKKTIANPDVKLEDAIENIDIGGPTMIRSAAKNYKHVVVVVDPKDYKKVLDEIKRGKVTEETKQKLAVKVFRHTADYDAAIDTFLSKKLSKEDILRMKFIQGQELRYGENWHQTAKFYKKEDVTESCAGYSEILHGKEMSFNNYVDANAALEVVKEFKDQIAVSIIKHTNPCGFATGKTLRQAFESAWNGDPVSAFGSVIACTVKVDIDAAQFLKGKFVEAVIAPDFDEDALEFLRNKSKNIRLLMVGDLKKGEPEQKVYKNIIGGMLEQSRDVEEIKEWKLVTKAKFPKEKDELAKFIWKVCKHVKSNSIMLGYEYEPGQFMVLGMGAGQPNRIDALRKLCVTKAKENIKEMGLKEDILSECVLASDAFFPFDDSIKEANKHNIKYIVQPGGSVKDEEVIAACDKLGVAMIFTGMRHFLH